MAGKVWLQPPRRVLTSFLVVVVACIGALAWLGHRLLEQDRALESQRLQDQLEIAADLAAAALERQLSVLASALDVPAGTARLPEDTVLIVAGAQNLELSGTPRLVFQPEFETPQVLPDDRLSQAEVVEFQKNDPGAAASLFRGVAKSTDPAVRAAALVRLGRSLRKNGRIREALAAYSELAALGSVPVSGLPAEVVAREARCSTLEASGQVDDLRQEAAALLRDLNAGRWRLTRSAWPPWARAMAARAAATPACACGKCGPAPPTTSLAASPATAVT